MCFAIRQQHANKIALDLRQKIKEFQNQRIGSSTAQKDYDFKVKHLLIIKEAKNTLCKIHEEPFEGLNQ